MKTIIFIIFITIIIKPSEARASELSLTISPPTATYTLNPGETTQGIIKLTNNTLAAISFQTRMSDFIVEDSKGTPVMLEPNTFGRRFSASSWITLEPSSFILDSRQTQPVFYTISIPASARPGGHYSSVLFVPQRKDLGGKNTTSVETQVGALISISVKGAISEHSQITRFTANTFQEYGPVKLFATIRNFGDLHIRPSGKIAISDFFGRTVTTAKLKEVNIFPEAQRDYETTLGTKLMIGRFKAKLSATYGVNNNLPLSATLYFWVIPWKIVVVIVLAVITTILAIIYWRRTQNVNIKNQN